MDVPITEKLRLIDEYLAFPSENDPRWMVMIREYREYVEMERAMENEN